MDLQVTNTVPNFWTVWQHRHKAHQVAYTISSKKYHTHTLAPISNKTCALAPSNIYTDFGQANTFHDILNTRIPFLLRTDHFGSSLARRSYRVCFYHVLLPSFSFFITSDDCVCIELLLHFYNTPKGGHMRRQVSMPKTHTHTHSRTPAGIKYLSETS